MALIQVINGINGNIEKADFEMLRDMDLNKYANYKGNIVVKRRDYYYDLLIYNANTLVPQNLKMTAFRQGLEEQGKTSNGTAYQKELFHTNMMKGGEFEAGSLTIIEHIVVGVTLFAGTPAATDNGKVTNAKASFPATIDPLQVEHAFLNQLQVNFRRGRKDLWGGKGLRFTQPDTVNGAYGANSGAMAVNGGHGVSPMQNIEILDGGEDFDMQAITLAPFDLTAASGVNREIVVEIGLVVSELERVH